VTEINLVQAVNLALRRAMEEDPRVLVLARTSARTEACSARPKGCCSATATNRVLDTPLAEASIAVSPSASPPSFRPVAEIQFTGFLYACIDQLVNHASRLRTRTAAR